MASPSQAQGASHTVFYTGNDLYAKCNADLNTRTGPFDWAACRGYIFGGVDFYLNLAADRGANSCTRPTVTGKQIVDTVIAYLRDHPETRDRPGFYAVASVMPQFTMACANR